MAEVRAVQENIGRFGTEEYAENISAAVGKFLVGIVNNEVKTTDHPVAIATMGSPGAGKTSLLNALAEATGGDVEKIPQAIKQVKNGKVTLNHEAVASFGNAIYISSDLARQYLAEQDEVKALFGLQDSELKGPELVKQIYKYDDKELVGQFHRAGNVIAEKAVIALMEQAKNGNKYSLIFDTTFGKSTEPSELPGDNKKREQMMAGLAQLGYKEMILPVRIDAETAKHRLSANKGAYFDEPGLIDEYVTGYDARLGQIKKIAGDINKGGFEHKVDMIEFNGKDMAPVSSKNWAQQQLENLANMTARLFNDMVHSLNPHA